MSSNNKELSKEVTDLEALAAGAKLAIRTGLPEELFNALNPEKAVSDLVTLFTRKPKDLQEALATAINDHKVDPSVAEKLADLEALRRTHEAISNFANRLNIPLAPQLDKVITSNGIHTLSDIAKAGGLQRIEGLPPDTDVLTLKLLDAHADLSKVAPDSEVNAKVIERGFLAMRDIAAVQVHEFVGAMGGVLGTEKSHEFYALTVAYNRTLNNTLTDKLGGAANRYLEHGTLDGINGFPGPPEKCNCEDCESAVSPLAYLADLLDYSQRHLRNDVSPLVKQYGNDTTMYALRIANKQSNSDMSSDGNFGAGTHPGSGTRGTGIAGVGGGGTHVLQPPNMPIIVPLSRNVSTYVVDVTFRSNATVFYTLDGSDPVPGVSAQYDDLPVKLVNSSTSNPLTVTVKALAALESTEEANVWVESDVASAIFTLAPMAKAAAPSIAPSGETALFAPATIFIVCNDPSVVVRYTIDGGDPDEQSPQYAPMVFLSPGRHTVKAKGFLPGYAPSDLVTAIIVVETAPVSVLAPLNGLTAEYYQNIDLSDLQVLTRDAFIQFDWNDKSP